MLGDTREIIRNEVLLLMAPLTRGHVDVQKILAFEGAFEILFGIAKDEEEGSIVGTDSISVACNLLKNNASNVTYFREMGGLQEHVLPLIRKAASSGGELYSLALDVVNNIMTASSAPEDMQTNQTALGKHGILSEVRITRTYSTMLMRRNRTCSTTLRPSLQTAMGWRVLTLAWATTADLSGHLQPGGS